MSERTERDIMLAWCEMMLIQAKHGTKSEEIIQGLHANLWVKIGNERCVFEA
jgi:hypothetical protein